MSPGPGARDLPPAQEVVERTLAASRADGCAVIVEEVSQAEVRFANNTTTTNGVRRNRRVAVVSFRSLAGAGGGPTAVGVASGSGEVDVEALVRASEAEASGAGPAEDAFALVEPDGRAAGAGSAADSQPGGGAGFDEPPVPTSPAALAGVITGLGDAFGRARAAGNRLAGFATHGIETVYLGTSTGLRLRHAQPAGTMELVARSADGSRSVWAGAGTSTFEDIDLHAFEQRLDRRLAWAERRVELPAGHYEVLLPPDATADLMVAMSEAMSGRDAEEGRSPFSSPGGRHQDRRITVRAALRVARRPRGTGARVCTLPGHGGVGDRCVSIRQRAAHRPHGLDRGGPVAAPALPPCRRRAFRRRARRRRSAT